METKHKIAQSFVNILKEWLSEAEFTEVVKRNAEDKDKSICHSHDFCDANMAMDEAFNENLLYLDYTEENINLFSDAWREAKKIMQKESK